MNDFKRWAFTGFMFMLGLGLSVELIDLEAGIYSAGFLIGMMVGGKYK